MKNKIGSIDIQINITSDNWKPFLKSNPSIIKKTVQQAFASIENSLPKTKTIELSLLFCDDSEMQTLNKQYRGNNKPTNVLSFPQADIIGNDIATIGDIILSYDTIRQEAIDQEKALIDHVQHLLVHGILHLLGHDHVKNKDAIKMEKLEVEILKKLGVKNPYNGS